MKNPSKVSSKGKTGIDEMGLLGKFVDKMGVDQMGCYLLHSLKRHLDLYCAYLCLDLTLHLICQFKALAIQQQIKI